MVEQRNQADHGCGRYSKRSIVAGSIPALGTEVLVRMTPRYYGASLHNRRLQRR